MVNEGAALALLGVYTVMSAVTFVAYWADKSAARHGRGRTSERTLHILALGGGWPGALVAQRVFRHKTRKQPFRGIFWVTVVSNCAFVSIALAASLAARG